jgi:hypothetical protein
METETQIAERWRYLRSLLHEQLARLESGSLQLHAGPHNVTPDAINRLKREIDDFDVLISRSEKRNS